MKKLTDKLKPLRKVLSFEQCLNFAAFGLVLGICFSIGFLIVSKFILISDANIKVWLFIAIAALFGVIFALVKVPSFFKVAVAADALGFKERFTTAFELLQSDMVNSKVAQMVIDDAMDKAQKMDLRKLYKVKFPKRKIYTSGLLLICMLFVGFIPSPYANKLKEQEIIKTKMEEEIKKVEAVKKEVLSELTKKEADEVNAKLKELTKDMKKASTQADAMKATQKFHEELKKLANNTVPKDLKRLGEALSNNKMTRPLGDSLQKGDLQKIKKNIDDLNKLMENMSDEDLKKLADEFAKAAEEFADNPELLNTLNELTNTLNNSDSEGITSSLQQFNEKLSSMAASNSKLRDALNKLDSSVSKTTNTEQSPSNKNEEQQSGEQEGNQQGNQGNGNQGNQPGGQNGSGGQGNGGQGNQPGGNGRGKGHLENENIYSRDAINKADYEAKVDGAQNSSGTLTLEEQKGLGQMDKNVPYTQVLTEYKNEALQTLDEFEVPHGMKELVKQYFSTLE